MLLECHHVNIKKKRCALSIDQKKNNKPLRFIERSSAAERERDI